MISRIQGVLLEKQAPHILVDVHGVGYELLAPMTTFFSLPELSEQVTLHTHFSVSETAQQLFGFLSTRDRELFRLLIKVSGVGPKMAVGLMSMDTDSLVRCVMSEDVAALVKIPGVGKKTAERLIVEMRDKLKSWAVADQASASDGSPSGAADTLINSNTILAEAESALIALGYKPVEAAKAVSAANDGEQSSAEELIRMALKSMLPADK
jgi:Holliday junction DNA helicase RuvA